MGKIRVGVVGLRRGRTFMRAASAAGMELAAICDTNAEPLQKTGAEFGVATYTDYDAFLQHDMEAVILANYFHEHAPFAIKALRSGRHVMSECAACHTLAEGVALIRAVEETGQIYMFAENYPYSACNQEMAARFRAGEIGDFRYGEGEYVHPDPAEVKMARSCGIDHWRNWIPATYYCTHSLAPVMVITDTMPVSCNALVIARDSQDPTITMTVSRSDTACVILYRMDNGAVVKCIHGQLRGHGTYVRIHGNKGLMETTRHGERGQLRLFHDAWDRGAEEPAEMVYTPNFPQHHDLASKAGHGGGDFFVNLHFAEAIRGNSQPYLDVYRGVTMSIAGIQAWRSALANGAPVEIPDLRDAAIRTRYADDHWSPDPSRGPEHAPQSILGDITPSPEAMSFSTEVWKRQGYTGR